MERYEAYKDYSRTSLYQCVKFYRMFPEIVQTASGQSSPALSWSHYIELLRVEDPEARAWYARETAEQMWSVKTLSRNISTQWYHRLLATGFAYPPTSSCEPRSRNRNASLWRSRWSVRRCLRVRVSDMERYEAYVVAKLEGAPQ